MNRIWLTLGLVLLALLGFAQAGSPVYRPKAGETVMVLDIADRGKVAILLFTSETPKTTERIISLVRQKFYDGQRFHRVENSPKPFLVQVGDPASKRPDWESADLGTSGTGVRIPYEESDKKNVEGMVGLAHLPNDKDSGDCQFYMLLGPARFLDGNYTVFGQIKSGSDVLHRIKKGDKISSVTVENG